MDKIFIKPTAKEIMLKGSGKDGSSDLFSYDYADPGQRSLGHLYVVGNIQAGEAAAADDIDVGYVINLVASLAKREYYSKSETDPKEAFNAALKKINGVIEEFFKHKDTKINVGIFAIAGGQIHISKLGKFKILLARDGANIDILNNVDLFKKESTQEKQFSNIVSGSVTDGDRILAYYPSRVMTAREKLLKASLLDLGQADFAKKLEAIKDEKDDFACAAVHVELHKSKEPAAELKVQPKELQAEESEPEEVAEAPVVQAQLAKEEVTPEADEDEEVAEKVVEAPAIVEVPKIKAHIPVKQVEIKQEVPKIIPAEFSLGRKNGPLTKYTRQLKNMHITPQNRKFVMGGAAALVIIAVVVLKSFVFVSASAKAINSAVSQADSNIKAAQTKVSQNDLVGAHALLLTSLASIDQAIQANGTSSKITDAKNSVVKALDNIEQATDASLSLADGVDFSTVQNIPDNLSTLASQFTNAYLYQGNLYGLTPDGGISKITDANKGKTAAVSWLASGVSLVSKPMLVAVDGNVYVLSDGGVLSVYYKGQKKNDLNTPVVPDSSSAMLTTADGTSLYIVNKTLARIYVIDKTSGSLTKTLKINSDSPLTGAGIGADGTLYVMTDKVWKVAQ